VQDLEAVGSQGLLALKKVSFDVQAGEILGIAGVSGNGQSELTQVLSGVLKPRSGKVWVGDKDLTGAEPLIISNAGVGRIPEDRHDGVVGELTVAENIAMA
jgi:ABC-type uncharacterized transport system ATPase subunit